MSSHFVGTFTLGYFRDCGEADTAAIDAAVELMGDDRRDGQRTRLCGFDPVQKRFRTPPHQRDHRVGVEEPADHRNARSRSRRCCSSGRIGLRAQDHGIALARDLDLFDGEAEIPWQPDGLEVIRLEDLGNMEHGDHPADRTFHAALNEMG